MFQIAFTEGLISELRVNLVKSRIINKCKVPGAGESLEAQKASSVASAEWGR